MIEESKFFATKKDFDFLILSQNNLTAMKNSINHSDDFFEHFFKDKKEEEIKEWIEKESEGW